MEEEKNNSNNPPPSSQPDGSKPKHPGSENLIPFRKGEYDSRRGRKPKGVPHSKTRLLKILTIMQKKKNPFSGKNQKLSIMDQLDIVMILKALKGDSKAYQQILDRLEGKPSQEVKGNIEVTNHTNPLENYTEAQIDKLIETISADTARRSD